MMREAPCPLSRSAACSSSAMLRSTVNAAFRTSVYLKCARMAARSAGSPPSRTRRDTCCGVRESAMRICSAGSRSAWFFRCAKTQARMQAMPFSLASSCEFCGELDRSLSSPRRACSSVGSPECRWSRSASSMAEMPPCSRATTHTSFESKRYRLVSAAIASFKSCTGHASAFARASAPRPSDALLLRPPSLPRLSRSASRSLHDSQPLARSRPPAPVPSRIGSRSPLMQTISAWIAPTEHRIAHEPSERESSSTVSHARRRAAGPSAAPCSVFTSETASSLGLDVCMPDVEAALEAPRTTLPQINAA
mmetsp:Transcript_34743/g.81404  ORF Transcript_34743/g.81404 Transcript_34743/m.81404 type:complete len:308 (+) Transcript_34743:203-1126(+)